MIWHSKKATRTTTKSHQTNKWRGGGEWCQINTNSISFIRARKNTRWNSLLRQYWLKTKQTKEETIAILCHFFTLLLHRGSDIVCHTLLFNRIWWDVSSSSDINKGPSFLIFKNTSLLVPAASVEYTTEMCCCFRLFDTCRSTRDHENSHSTRCAAERWTREAGNLSGNTWNYGRSCVTEIPSTIICSWQMPKWGPKILICKYGLMVFWWTKRCGGKNSRRHNKQIG